MLLNLLLQGAGETGAEGSTEVVPTEKTLSILELIANGGWYIMIPLGILSVVAVYIFIERFIAIRKASKEDPQFMNQIKDFIHDGKIDAANHLCKQTDTTYARMIEKGVKRIGKPLGDISAAVENVGKLEVFKLEESLSTLATIAGAAPMIGFLGTVIGMIIVFHEMRISDSGIEIEALSGGIMQAMVTTVAGLVIGIIAYIAYNVLVARVEKVVYKMEATTIEFMDLLQEPAE
ncbi:MAG: MotA/TolQ/ExbB proton channel family protein [Salibacteraceae bacterium]|jgi:biopolymer transport protein ExbB|nr:MotA/TolQ/ExbB proton channel family protein [Salibacteraceae bacterium]MDP4685922.1 MotA/TolQ/ExbB proton channel family protein [Salibacteraceae bacterium]MDP4762859.1 MotA/TolQ/ExbB proton channel family protein [Salibacteraceae bacterium]MDP4843135.1 MotA/TolQ/ExbB proton channel family protein [Salibacteraceae bacterium]MDP4934124.1 MotA/TolQ/ExbB proton channel family protein [Salibacteraceae bacterium]